VLVSLGFEHVEDGEDPDVGTIWGWRRTLAAATPEVRLRPVEDDDLEVLFAHESDPVAAEMAAFPSRERERFMAHWARLRADDTLVTRAIEVDGVVAGNIGSWPDDGRQHLGYWVGREWWGRGVATRALALMLDEVPVRPLHAHVAAHNLGSIRVVEKCGFVRDHAQEAAEPPSDDGVVELSYVLA
jgi:RimJ/RimL family protein N-acetyltransferase